MINTNQHTIGIFAFRAIDEPQLCAEYLAEHEKILHNFGVTSVTTVNKSWFSNPNIYCIVAQDVAMNKIIGGIRIQIADNIHPLPVEIAVGHLVTTLKEKIKKQTTLKCIAELCGLWVSLSYTGSGLARYLNWAAIATSNQLGINSFTGICSKHIFPLFSTLGFIHDNSIEGNVSLDYPGKGYTSNVIEITDTQTLQDALPEDRKNIFILRDQLQLTRKEIFNNFCFTITYNIKIV